MDESDDEGETAPMQVPHAITEQASIPELQMEMVEFKQMMIQNIKYRNKKRANQEQRFQNPDKCKTDQTMAKELFRKFRDFTRRSFLQQYQKKQYHWVLGTKRAKVKEYFTLGIPGFYVDEQMFNEYEHVFFELIHPMSRSFGQEWIIS